MDTRCVSSPLFLCMLLGPCYAMENPINQSDPKYKIRGAQLHDETNIL